MLLVARRQKGQALVLIAMTLIVLIGFIGLAIDGGRGYWERRLLQNAVDAAALAASDNYQDTASTSASMQAAAVEYAANERIGGSATATPAWTATAIDVTWAGAPDKVHMTAAVTGTLATFDVSSTHQIGLAFMTVLGTGPTINITGSAQGRAKTGGTSGAGLVTLNKGNCSGGVNSLSIGSGATIHLLNGNVQVNGSANLGTGQVLVDSGSFSANCGATTGVTASKGAAIGVAPVADPGFPSGSLTAYPTPQLVGTNVTLNPGIYNADIGGSANSCFFLAGGIYQLKAGFNATAGIWSNQLRAPDEPAWVPPGKPDYNTNPSSPQWWGRCAGSFSVAATAEAVKPLPAGDWGVILTSTRTDYYPSLSAGGTAYPRESAPSTCRKVTVGANQAITVTVNNVPGATGYNVYMVKDSPQPCMGSVWGYVGNMANPAPETQLSRGTVTGIFNATQITIAPTTANISTSCASGALVPNCAASTGQFGSANPPGDGGETAPRVISSANYPPQSPARDIPSAGGGDRGNDHQCTPAGTSSAAPCVNATVTPGAVQIYFPVGSCFSWTANATMRIFSGYQYNWMAIYAPLANTCTVRISDAASVVVNGTYYWPGGVLSLNGNAGYDIYFSQIIVDRYETTGNETLFIGYDATSVAPQGFSQISR